MIDCVGTCFDVTHGTRISKGVLVRISAKHVNSALHLAMALMQKKMVADPAMGVSDVMKALGAF